MIEYLTDKWNKEMRGYYGIGVEGISKPYNLGNLFRSAHAFGASFVFTVNAAYKRREGKHADTSDSMRNLPYYEFADADDMILPKDCALVGVELVDDAIFLPSFRHPLHAAYILGPERSSLSPSVLKKCQYTVKIPTKFCLNVGIAGVLVMYDRLLSMDSSFADRPVKTGGPASPYREHFHGSPLDLMKSRRKEPPLVEVDIADNS